MVAWGLSMTTISDEKNQEVEKGVEDQEAMEQASQQSDTTGRSESTDTKSENEFDSESLEISFGLPPGSLEDVKDEASALKMLRDHADQTLLAGLVGEQTAAAPPVSPIAPAPPAKSKDVVADTLDGEPAMLQRIAALEAKLEDREKQFLSQQLADIERRLMVEVDSWTSPKYGVTGTRSYNQTKAMRELVYELIPNYARGARSGGVQLPEPEVIARRIRVHTDESYKPSARKADANTGGTPGQRREPAGSKQPRSIHERVFNMK